MCLVNGGVRKQGSMIERTGLEATSSRSSRSGDGRKSWEFNFGMATRLKTSLESREASPDMGNS